MTEGENKPHAELKPAFLDAWHTGKDQTARKIGIAKERL